MAPWAQRSPASGGCPVMLHCAYISALHNVPSAAHLLNFSRKPLFACAPNGTEAPRVLQAFTCHTASMYLERAILVGPGTWRINLESSCCCACCSEARQSTVAQWGWPPPELAAPAALPLLEPASGGSKRPRGLGRRPAAEAAATLAPSAAAPGGWHAPEVEAALAAALQAAALPPALDGAAAGDSFAAPASAHPSLLT